MNYSTADYYLTAYLLSTGFQFVSLDRKGQKTEFQFPESDMLQLHVRQYYALQGTVDAQQYANALKNIKNIIYQNTNTYGTINTTNEQRKGN